MVKPIFRWIRDQLPNSTRKQITRVGNFFAPFSIPYPSIEGALLSLRTRGFAPNFAVDIGAFHGEWTLLFKQLFPAAAVLMIEAQEQKRERLEEICRQSAGTVSMRIALLGAETGQIVRFVEMENGSSVYEEQSKYDRKITERRTETLDDVLAAETRKVDFLKLDVQGYELQIMRGASRALKEAECVLLEASLVPINKGCPLASEVIEFMSTAGFRLLDFCSQMRRTDGTLWQTDLLFVRNSSQLVPDATLSPDNWV